MNRSRLFACLLGPLSVLPAAALQPISARADVPPPGVKSVEYTLTIANRAQFPDWVFIVYPTSNNGYGYVLEEGKPISNVMMGSQRRTGPSRLHAMKRADFDKFAAKAPRHPHGDHDEMVMVVNPPPPPPGSLQAAAAIEPPEGIPMSSTIVGVERVYRIKRLDAAKFELALAEETTIHKDGKREKRKVH